MATGYTQSIIDKNLSFADFAKICARAFGALISMRDDSLDEPIPTELLPSDYHKKATKQAIDDLKKLGNTSNDKLRADWEAENKESLDYYIESDKKKNELKKKLVKMLIQVKRWVPPTPEHQGLKDFMIKQIDTTIEWDCTIYERTEPLSFNKWLEEKTATLTRDIEYHKKEYAEEVKRCEERTKWIQDLLKSLEIKRDSMVKTAINDKPLEGNTVAPPLVVGQEYPINEVYTCPCGQEHYDVGLKSKYTYISCYNCKVELPRGTEIHWAHPSRFE